MQETKIKTEELETLCNTFPAYPSSTPARPPLPVEHASSDKEVRATKPTKKLLKDKQKKKRVLAPKAKEQANSGGSGVGSANGKQRKAVADSTVRSMQRQYEENSDSGTHLTELVVGEDLVPITHEAIIECTTMAEQCSAEGGEKASERGGGGRGRRGKERRGGGAGGRGRGGRQRARGKRGGGGGRKRQNEDSAWTCSSDDDFAVSLRLDELQREAELAKFNDSIAVDLVLGVPQLPIPEQLFGGKGERKDDEKKEANLWPKLKRMEKITEHESDEETVMRKDEETVKLKRGARAVRSNEGDGKSHKRLKEKREMLKRPRGRPRKVMKEVPQLSSPQNGEGKHF